LLRIQSNQKETTRFCSRFDLRFQSNRITNLIHSIMPSNTFATFNTPIDFIYMFCALGCVLCAALAAGKSRFTFFVFKILDAFILYFIFTYSI
jgi:hypothetical protein